jgi:hypothetical protein
MAGTPREVVAGPTENPKKTQYITNGRALAQQLINQLKAAQDYDSELNKLGFNSAGVSKITQEDLDFAMSKTYPAGAAGSLTLADWEAGVYSIGKNGNDYAGGEDIALLKISS